MNQPSAYDVRHESTGSDGRFVITLDTGKAAELLYRVKGGGVWDAYRTFVPKEFEGRGLAGQLVNALVAAAHKSGVTIRPTCSYIAAWVKRHPDQADLFI